jgi:hypothetical protein
MAVETTTIAGKIYQPSGAAYTTAQGSLVASLSKPGRATDGASTSVVAGRILGTIAANGDVSIVLVPNDVISPAATYYMVYFSLVGPTPMSWMEKWSVVTTPDPIALGAVTRL